MHLAHPRYKRGKRSDDRYPTCHHERLGAMASKELLRFFEIALLEEAGIIILEQLRPELATDDVIQIIATNRCRIQAQPKDEQVQTAFFRGEDSGRKKQRISWKEGGYHEPCFRKDDAGKDSVDPCTVRVNERL